MTEPVVGQRDKRHRLFLGWSVRIWNEGRFYYSSVEKTRADAERVVDHWMTSFPKRHYKSRIKPRWRKEGRWRRALRELYEETPNITGWTTPARERAKKMLEEI